MSIQCSHLEADGNVSLFVLEQGDDQRWTLVMPAKTISVVLYTVDLDRSIAFYVEKLGFFCLFRQNGFARVSLGTAEIMLAEPNRHRPWKGASMTGAVYVDVNDVDALWERYKDCVQIAYPLEAMSYGLREFGVLDDNGYQLSFAQRIASDQERA